MNTVDVDTCIGVQPEDDRPLDEHTLIQDMDAAGIADALCIHFAAVRYDGPTGNAELCEICRQQPRLHPVAVINPSPYMGVAEEIHRWAEKGAVGYRFTPGRQGWSIDGEAFLWAWVAVAETGLPAFVEVSVSGEPSRLARATASLDVPLVLAHVTYSTLGEAVAVLERYGHVHLELCRLVTPGVVEGLISRVGAARLLYGSGAPAWEMAPTQAMIREAPIPAVDRDALLGGNARRLFRLERRGRA